MNGASFGKKNVRQETHDISWRWRSMHAQTSVALNLQNPNTQWKKPSCSDKTKEGKFRFPEPG